MGNPSMSKSNLSKSEYKYDLVVGTTAKAINANMKRWLISINDDKKKGINLIFKSVKRKGQAKKIELMTREEYQKIVATCGIDILTFDAGDYDADDNPDFEKFAKAATHKENGVRTSLDTIVKLNIGVPKMRSNKIPDIVELDDSSIDDVKFTLLFSSYHIIRMFYTVDETTATIKKADITKPDELFCKYRVKMNLRGTKFEELPESVKEKIKNLHGDNMFELSQLYMDLTTAHLITEPDVTVSDEVAEGLTKKIKRFLEELGSTNKDGEDAFVFGYLAKKPNKPARSSIKPTDLDFMVSPYSEIINGEKKENKKLNTLNYLVMADNNAFPMNKNRFSWNWIGLNEKNIHGAMAIRKGQFVDFLVKSMNKEGNPLNKVLFEPTVDYKAWFDGAVSKCSVKFGLDKVSGKKYDVEPNGNVILKKTFKGYKKDSATSGSVKKFEGYASASYDFDSAITLEKKTIKVYAKARYGVYAETPVFHNGASAYNYANYTYYATYTLETNINGELSVKRTEDRLIDNSTPATDNRDIDKINDMKELTNIDHKTIGTALKKAFKDYTKDLDTFLKKSFNGWIFPGTTTFTFADVQFSDNLDLVAAITYKDPSEE